MARMLVRLGGRVVLAVAIGLTAAAGLAAFRGGDFGEQFTVSLWIVGFLMVGMTVFSVSPSTRHAQGELSNVFLGRRFLGSDDRGGAGIAVVLGLAAAVIFGIALVLS